MLLLDNTTPDLHMDLGLLHKVRQYNFLRDNHFHLNQHQGHRDSLGNHNRWDTLPRRCHYSSRRRVDPVDTPLVCRDRTLDNLVADTAGLDHSDSIR